MMSNTFIVSKIMDAYFGRRDYYIIYQDLYFGTSIHWIDDRFIVFIYIVIDEKRKPANKQSEIVSQSWIRNF